MTRFSDKTVIVTGAGQGIGRAYAQAFAAEGARIVVVDLDGDKARTAAEPLDGALALQVDVAEFASTQDMAKQVLEATGRIDVLINNAAIFSTLKMKPFDEIETDEWDRIMSVNARGVFNCCKAVAPAMKTQGAGKIVNISSSVVATGRPFYAHYVASKGAVVALTRALASELGTFGINVNAISPHGIVTEVERETIREDQWDEIIAAQALKRKGSIEDMLGVTLFLASSESDYMTGQTLNVDAGLRFN
ncbi:MAG: glucose 1-dehydrogenase [Pseudomonadota bacterium]